MTKPPPASLPTRDQPQGHSPHPSPEKKKQKKRHTNHSQEAPIKPKNLFFGEIPTTKIDPQPLWKTLCELHPSHGNPYTQAQLFAESGKSLHQDATKANAILAKILDKDPTSLRKSIPTPAEWDTLFTKAIKKVKPLPPNESKFLIRILMDLSTTNPNPLFKSFQKENGNLRITLMTSIWFSAQTLCGSNYDTEAPKTSQKSPPITTYLNALKQATEKPQPGTRTETPINPYKPNNPPTTPKASNQKEQLPTRKNRERYDMKIYIDPLEQNPITGFVNRAREWFTNLKTLDPSLAILPWFKNSKLNPILSPANIPSEMKILRNYFQRLSPKSGIIWTKVHLMLDHAPTEITSGPTTQMGWWYKEHEEGLYLRPLRDAETTQDLGILAYTSNFTNANHTMELINAAMKERGCKFNIGGKLRPIKSLSINEKAKAQHRAKGGTWQNQYWFALHLIADVNHQRQAIRHLYRLFNQKDTPQPGGLRARFIPNEGIITMSSSASGKRFKMIKKHKAVIQSLHIMRTDAIISLDDKNTPTNFTLRHYLSTIKHMGTGRPLFHSVDFSSSFMDEGSNTVILTAHQEHATEASALVSVLPALCHQKLHPSTNDWFTYDSIEHCEGVIFDSDSNKFKSNEDILFDEMLDEDFGEAATTIQFEGLSEAMNSHTSISANKHSSDDGSFVSFGTAMDAKKNTNMTASLSGNDSLSSPSFLSTSINEQTAESLAVSNAENEELRRQVRDLLLEKEQWETSNSHRPSTPPPTIQNSSYSTTFNPSPTAGTRSKNASPSDD